MYSFLDIFWSWRFSFRLSGSVMESLSILQIQFTYFIPVLPTLDSGLTLQEKLMSIFSLISTKLSLGCAGDYFCLYGAFSFVYYLKASG